jgi:hypothetical protein
MERRESLLISSAGGQMKRSGIKVRVSGKHKLDCLEKLLNTSPE